MGMLPGGILSGMRPKAQLVVRGALIDSVFAASYTDQMYRLRYDVFYRRLQWDVQVRDGLEYDRFDDADSVYMLTTDAADQVTGGWRLRPTTRSYMLRDVFPQLLDGNIAPRDSRVWEISRFAVHTKTCADTAGFSMGDTARSLLADAVKFAVQHGVAQYVLVTSVSVERLIVSTGVVLHRFGSPVRIGRVMSVACWVDIDAHTRQVLLGEPAPIRIAAKEPPRHSGRRSRRCAD